jgi:hypothetical protein
MGACQSEEAREQGNKNREIERQILNDKRKGNSVIKLLLLGMFFCIYT